MELGKAAWAFPCCPVRCGLFRAFGVTTFRLLRRTLPAPMEAQAVLTNPLPFAEQLAWHALPPTSLQEGQKTEIRNKESARNVG